MYPGRAAGFEWSLGIHLGHFPGDVSLVSAGAEHSWVQLPVCSCTVGAHTPTERKSPLEEPVINSRDTCQAGINPEPGILSQQEPGGASHFFHGFNACALRCHWLFTTMTNSGLGSAVPIARQEQGPQQWDLSLPSASTV